MYMELNKPNESISIDDENEMINLHKGYTDELKATFSNALAKDRMYHKASGFIEDQQIWLMGVLLKYAINKVLHMNHQDFLAALRCDLCPLLGDTGMWMVQQYKSRQVERGNDEKKKKARTLIDILENF